MNILYIGDVMGEPGIRLIERQLPQIRRDHQVDFVVAQAENTTEGRGISVADFARLRKAGVDFCTGGNWSLWRDEIVPAMSDPAQPIIRPANYPDGTPGLGYKYADTPKGKVLVISLLGQIVGRDAAKPLDNPLQTIDRILAEAESHVATVVNFHGDFSSEKVIIGHYLDGRVSVVVGDHWHVPTADARVLPGGTAHQTDVGMCGVLNASLGITFESVVPRWHSGVKTRNQLATDGPYQFNA
ncbi:MAG: Metallophosphoesterase, partial [Candidatus Saccharibacteria bacterium]|nr:Metallophosphoesterase [Candidatus Saccharibacteria bacterium]